MNFSILMNPSNTSVKENLSISSKNESLVNAAGVDCVSEGYGVIVLNPNENYIEVEKTKKQTEPSPDSSDEPAEKRERKDEKETKKRRDFYEKYRKPQQERETEQIPIRENSSPEEHVVYVWDNFISKSSAKNIFFVAHSYGGLSFVELVATQNPTASDSLRIVTQGQQSSVSPRHPMKTVASGWKLLRD
ncbi:UNVERIFIED_CONTAM: hypothetical protein FKN15_042336 [Acipenser sinensis]